MGNISKNITSQIAEVTINTAFGALAISAGFPEFVVIARKKNK